MSERNNNRAEFLTRPNLCCRAEETRGLGCPGPEEQSLSASTGLPAHLAPDVCTRRASQLPPGQARRGPRISKPTDLPAPLGPVRS